RPRRRRRARPASARAPNHAAAVPACEQPWAAVTGRAGSGGSVPASSAGLGPPSDGGWQFPQRSPGSPESGAPASADPPSAGGGATTAGYVTKPPSNVALAGTPFTVTAEAPGAFARKSRTGLPVTARVAPSGVVFFEIALWLECIIRLSPLWRIATIN